MVGCDEVYGCLSAMLLLCTNISRTLICTPVLVQRKAPWNSESALIGDHGEAMRLG